VSKLRGSTVPRLFTAPLVRGRPGPCGCGCALTPETSLGFSMLAFIEGVVGAQLLPWQRWLAIHAFELAPPGAGRRFRYRTVLILIARQNGKTTWVELKNLWKMFILQVPLVIGTAQKLDLAEESWTHAVDIAEAVPELAAEIATVSKGNGKKALVLLNGSRWKIEPATRGGGRGLAGDDVNLDELREHQNWLSWGAVSKTTLARVNAQVFAYTNAGDDKSIVLNSLQARARAVAATIDELLADLRSTKPEDIVDAIAAAGVDNSLGLFEWSVPDDVKCTCRRTGDHPHKSTCQLADRKLWSMANPSLGYQAGDFGLTEEALAAALASDPEAVFRTECLCQRVPDLNKAVIDAAVWESLTDPLSRPNVGDLVFAVDVSPSRDWASIAAYSVSVDDDGKALGHLELIEHREGTRWIVARLVALKDRYDPIAITLDQRSPAGSLLVDLGERDIKPQVMRKVADMTAPRGPDNDPAEKEVWDRGGLFVPSSQEIAAGCGQLVDAVSQALFRHPNQPPMVAAVSAAKARPLGDAWAWGRRLADVDISPLVAATLARYAHAKLSSKLAVDDDYDVLDSVY
jgi:hypothetical protein